MSAASLSQEQQGAATDPSPRVVVVAPPGSGKTATLAARVREIRNPRSNVPGARAVAITFTEKAAAELRERTDGAASCYTFHGFARHLLTLAGKRQTIYDQVDADDVACLVGEELGILKAGKYKDRRKAAEKVHADQTGQQRYVATLRKARAVDYDLLVSDGIYAARSVRMGEHFSDTQFLVDEAQDTSPDLWALLDALTPRALFVVGDPRQQIYGWRGGSADRLLDAYGKGKAGGWSPHALTANFRSHPEIVAAGNRLARPMAFKSPEMVAARPSEGPCVMALSCDCSATEAQEVASWALGQSLDWTGGAPRAFILGRSWRSLEKVGQACLDLGISVHVGKKADLWTGENGRAFLRGLSLLVNPHQDIWTRVLARRLGTPDVSVLVAAENAALTDSPLMTWLTPGRPEWAPWRMGNDPMALDVAARIIADGLGVRGSEFAEIMDAVSAWEPDGPRDVEGFLAHVATRSEMDDAPEAAVWISTVHGVKGLEAPAVAIVGMDVGGFGERTEEERRLAFVAATRARDTLVASRSEHRGDPSPFWTEIEV